MNGPGRRCCMVQAAKKIVRAGFIDPCTPNYMSELRDQWVLWFLCLGM